MTRKSSLLFVALLSTFASAVAVLAQNKPVANVDPNRHQFIAAAQRHISEAWGSIDEAQRSNKEQLGGHAEKAKELLDQANAELKAAGEYADQHRK